VLEALAAGTLPRERYDSSSNSTRIRYLHEAEREPLGKTVRRATAGPIACSARRIEQPLSDNTVINTVDLCDNGLWGLRS